MTRADTAPAGPSTHSLEAEPLQEGKGAQLVDGVAPKEVCVFRSLALALALSLSRSLSLSLYRDTRDAAMHSALHEAEAKIARLETKLARAFRCVGLKLPVYAPLSYQCVLALKQLVYGALS